MSIISNQKSSNIVKSQPDLPTIKSTNLVDKTTNQKINYIKESSYQIFIYKKNYKKTVNKNSKTKSKILIKIFKPSYIIQIKKFFFILH